MLATEATALVHGRDAADRAAETARATFEQGDDRRETCPPSRCPRAELEKGWGVLTASTHVGFVASTGEARRQIKGGGIKVNDEAVTDEKRLLTLVRPHARGRDQALARQEAPRADPARVSTALLAAGRSRQAAPEDDGRGRRVRAPCRVNSKIWRKMPGVITDIGLTSTYGSSSLPLMAKVMPTRPSPCRPPKHAAKDRDRPEGRVQTVKRHIGAAEIDCLRFEVDACRAWWRRAAARSYRHPSSWNCRRRPRTARAIA